MTSNNHNCLLMITFSLPPPPPPPRDSGLKRALQCEEQQDHVTNWPKHSRLSPQANSSGNITTVSFAPPPQLIAVPAQSPMGGHMGGRFLILYSIPPTAHLAQFPNGTMMQQPSAMGGGADPPQLSIGGTHVIQATPPSGMNYATLAQPFLVNQPPLVSGTTVLPTVGNSSLFNGMVLVHPNTNGSLVCGHVPENQESSTKSRVSPTADSSDSTPGSVHKPTATPDNDSKNRHTAHPPPPPLLQLSSQMRVLPTTEGTKLSVLSPPLTSQANLSSAMIQSQMAGCIQRLVILGDLGKSQGGTMVLPASGESEPSKPYMMYDPHHQVVSSVPMYRFGSSHPIQILTPVGASVKKS